MKNVRTPRTLSECSFHVGYPAVEHAHHKGTDWRSIVLAFGIGIGLAIYLVSWWGS